MRWVGGFFRFWYDFVVGDDWTIAIAVVFAIALTALLTHHGRNAWLLLPAFVVGALSASVWRALR
jgi:hypothetical protein